MAATRPSIMSLGATASAPALCMVECHLRQCRDRGVIVDDAVRQHVAAVPVIGRAAQAHIGPHPKGPGHADLMPATARGTSPSGSRKAEPCGSFCIRSAEQDQCAHATVCATLPCLEERFRRPKTATPPAWLETGCRTFVPGTMNIGYTKSADGQVRVSRTMARQLSLLAQAARSCGSENPLVMLSSESIGRVVWAMPSQGRRGCLARLGNSPECQGFARSSFPG